VATRNGAQVRAGADDRGAIAPAKRADLALIDGGPHPRHRDIRKVAAVFKDGNVLYPSELFTEMGVKPSRRRSRSPRRSRAFARDHSK
jgi:cytosine/adenosine deaminase-related metal-dependent hydrolase